MTYLSPEYHKGDRVRVVNGAETFFDGAIGTITDVDEDPSEEFPYQVQLDDGGIYSVFREEELERVEEDD